MTQHLTAAAVRAANEAALLDGTLLALIKQSSGADSCQYRLGGFRCAIGVALDEKTLAEIELMGANEWALDDLLKEELGLLTVSNEADREYLIALQKAHDFWVTGTNPNARANYLGVLRSNQ